MTEAATATRTWQDFINGCVDASDLPDAEIDAMILEWKTSGWGDWDISLPEGHLRHYEVRCVVLEENAAIRARVEENERIAAVRLGIDVTTMRAVQSMIDSSLTARDD